MPRRESEMSKQKKAEVELDGPPAEPVWWVGEGQGPTLYCKTQTWFAARQSMPAEYSVRLLREALAGDPGGCAALEAALDANVMPTQTRRVRGKG